MKYLIISILSLLLINCASETVEKEAQQAPKSDSIAIVDTSLVITVVEQPIVNIGLTDNDKQSLKPYLTSAQISRLNNAINTFETSTSDLEVIKAFSVILEVTDTLKNKITINPDYEKIDENEDYYPFTLQTELAGLEQTIPGFINTCIAECTEYNCSFELAPFIQKSKETEGQADDDFFEALSIGYGERMTTAHTFKAWFAQMWDYGGATLLGNDTHFIFLKKAQSYNATYHVANDILNDLIESAYEDIMHGIYMNDPIKVTKEIRKISALNVYSTENNEFLNNFATQIENGNYEIEQLGGRILQFNCETGNCDFGG